LSILGQRGAKFRGDMEILPVRFELPREFQNLFVNRGAFTLQSDMPNRETGRHYFYRPTDRRTGKGVSLSLDTIRRHLAGWVTIGLYALNPETLRSKWLAIDADYERALADLAKLAECFKGDGVSSALENSRRGGHLWVFMAEPLPARDIRIYALDVAARVGVRIKQANQDGLEFFPKQDILRPGEFGSAIRGPLGIHRGAARRFWFQDAAPDLASQMEFLKAIPKMAGADLARLIKGNAAVAECRPGLAPGDLRRSKRRRGFQILQHIQTPLRRAGRNLVTACPSCRAAGRDTGGDNLSISTDGEKYVCWAGCSRDDIRVALGCPRPTIESVLGRAL
jgi:hypothetical protein